MTTRAAALLVTLAACGQQSDAPDLQASLFRESSGAARLTFQHFNGATRDYHLPEIMGPGIALLDYDLDGDLDIYALQGGTLADTSRSSPSDAAGHGQLGNRLFENRIVPDKVLRFVDSTEGSGLGIESYAMGVAVGDYDADGDPDIYLTSVGPNFLLRNNGDGTFQTVEGPQDERWSTSATFTDYDSDGDLDLFFANFVDYSPGNNKKCYAPTGERDYCLPTVYNPVPDRLFRNDDGRFTDVTESSGIGRAFGNGLGVLAVDLNQDGLSDLYVANDTTENQLWVNEGQGNFVDVAMQSGAAVNADGRVEAGMGVAAADFDGDGDEDLLMTHNVQETNTLYLNSGRGLFRDATNTLGLGNSSLPFTGFGLAWADFDHDGVLDVFIANGAVAIMESQRGSPFPFVQDNTYYRGDGGRFEVVSGLAVWGPVEPKVSRGLAAGDIDLDGDTDIVVANCNGPVRLYINQTSSEDWVRIRLEGTAGNPAGLGARVGLCWPDGTCQWRRVHRDGSYLSSSEPVAHFVLAGLPPPAYAEVRWPAGRPERYPLPAPGRALTLRQGAGAEVR
ncbi:MAG: CRTAC1 family protein [Bryobacterales bacterium]|nr:CRTAC1 family protein [Bryobacterales bacterium]